jgi:glycosyltransferase involved in cell wall biosynthesis
VKPTVCVAISVKNGVGYLAASIESVLAQEGVSLDVRLYDNGSSDGSVELARTYPGLTVTVNAVDLNFYGSMNRALSETRADWFVAWACDDVMEPGNLARKIAAAERAGAGFAHGPVWRIDGNDRVLEMGDCVDDLPDVVVAPWLFRYMTPQNAIGCPGTIVARCSAVREIGGFDARFVYCGDWLTWMRLSLRNDAAIVRDPLVRYRQHEAAGMALAAASAVYAEQVPPAIHLALHDEAYPSFWNGLRPVLEAACLANHALMLGRDGHRRAADGWSAWALALRALALAPADPALPRLVSELATAAGLVPPVLPLDLIGIADPESARALIETVRPLAAAGLVGSFGIASEGPLDPLVEALRAALADAPEVSVTVVPVAPETLARPRCVFAAPWRSPAIAPLEARGVPVLPYGCPTPLAVAPDPARWQLVRAA